MNQITVEKTAEDSASKSLQVTVPVDRVREAEARALKYYAKRARLPGFRPGKAPDTVVRKRFGDAIRQTVLEEVIRESWETAKTSESLKPITDPAIRNLKFEEGSPIEFELHVEVRPELKLERVGGFRLEREGGAGDRQRGGGTARPMQEQKAAWIPVEGAKPAPGQMVRVEVAPIENGVAGASQPHDLVLGDNQAIPELEERIMALLPGETAEAEVRFPDDHPDESRRGQTRRVRIALHEVKRQELPPLDDALAREAGDFESLEALRAAVRQDLEREASREADAEVRRDLMAQLVEANRVEAPALAGAPADARLRRDVQGPGGPAAGFEQQFHRIAEAQVQAGPGAGCRWSRRTGFGPPRPSWTSGSTPWPRPGACPPASSTRHCKRPTACSELERAITEEKVFDFLLKQSTVEEVKS